MAYVVSKAGSTAKFVFLSKNDITSTAPTRNEFVLFNAADAQLKLRYNTETLDNKQVKIYRYYGDTKPAYTEMLELFRGVIQHHRINNRTLDLEIRKDEGKIDISLPKTVITKEVYTDVPPENIGKAIPIVFGDFTGDRIFVEAVGSIIETYGDDLCESVGYFKAYLIKQYNSATIHINTYLYANHALKDLRNIAAMWESSIDSFVLVPCRPNMPGIGDGSSGFSPEPGYFPYDHLTSENDAALGLMPVLSKIIKYDSNTTVPDYANSQDTDPTNWSTITEHGDAWAGSNSTSWGVSGAFDTIAFVIETSAAAGYGTNCLVFRHRTYNGAGGEIDDVSESIITDGQHVFYLTDKATIDASIVHVTINIHGGVYVSPTSHAESFDGDYPIKFRNIQILRGYSADLGKEIFLNGQGKADDGSGTITGTASLLFQNPVHILKSLAVSEMGLTTAQLDTTDITTAITTLTSWKFAFQLLDVISGIDLLNKIGEQCKSSIFRDELDRLSISPWDDTKSFPNSATDIPDDYDIFQESCDPVTFLGIQQSLRNPIMLESLTLDQVPIENVYNSFELKFRKNYATDGYQEVLTMDNGSGVVGAISTTLVAGDEASMENSQTIAGLKALCAASYTDIGSITRKLIFEADYIRDRATAVKLFQHLIECYTPRRYIVEFTTKENALWVEFGDIINVRHSRIFERFGTPTGYRKKWAVYKIGHKLNSCDMTFKAIEV